MLGSAANSASGCVCMGADVSEELVAFLPVYDCSGGVESGEFDFQYPMVN